MKNRALVAIVTLLVSACAAQQELLKPTASGYPEGIFANASVNSVRSKLIEGCSSLGVLVQEANGNQVLCGKTMEGGEAVFSQMLLGNSYSTTPQRKVRFVIYQIGPDVKVTAQQWIESQMAMGQVRQQELKDNNQNNDIQKFLFSLGADTHINGNTTPTHSNETQIHIGPGNSNAPVNSGAIQDIVKNLTAGIQELCKDQNFKEYYEKTACSAIGITLTQMADTSKITPIQQPVLLAARRAADSLNKKFSAAYRETGQPQLKRIADYYEGVEWPKNELLTMELYDGVITWGQYNRRRKEYNQEANEATRRIR